MNNKSERVHLIGGVCSAAFEYYLFACKHFGSTFLMMFDGSFLFLHEGEFEVFLSLR